MLIQQTLQEFRNNVASSSPAPGGGSCSALASAIGCSLAAMLCELTIPKAAFSEKSESDQQAFIDAFDLMKQSAAKIEPLIDEDTNAFNAIMAAFKLPKSTDDEKSLRSAAIQDATWQAINVPLMLSEYSLCSLEQLPILLTHGNTNALSDLGVGVLLLQSGLRGAHLNVKINLGGIKDALRAEEVRDLIANREQRAQEITDQLLQQISDMLS